MSASDATKSKLLVLVDVLIKNEIVFEIVGFGFSILVAQGAQKEGKAKKEHQRERVCECPKNIQFHFLSLPKLFVKTS